MGARSSQAVAYHISCVGDRPDPPAIVPLHREFFHGTRVDGETSESVQIVKNIHVTPIVSIVDSLLVVSAECLAELRKVSNVRSKATVVESTYLYPFAAGDKSFLEDSAYSFKIKSYQRIAMRFYKKYVCNTSYPHTIVALDVPFSREGVPDSVQVRIPDLPGEGGVGWELELSLADVRTHGIVSAFGFVVSPEVWSIIGKHLQFPYFIVHQIDQKGHAKRVPLK